VLQVLHTQPASRILMVCPSNDATDNLSVKLISGLQGAKFIRVNAYQRARTTVQAELRPYCLDDVDGLGFRLPTLDEVRPTTDSWDRGAVGLVTNWLPDRMLTTSGGDGSTDEACTRHCRHVYDRRAHRRTEGAGARGRTVHAHRDRRGWSRVRARGSVRHGAPGKPRTWQGAAYGRAGRRSQAAGPDRECSFENRCLHMRIYCSESNLTSHPPLHGIFLFCRLSRPPRIYEARRRFIRTRPRRMG